MIVYCEKCKSKFKVDDAKIPAAGVMASCSVCSHRFHLKRELEVVDLETASIVSQSARAASAPTGQERKETLENAAASVSEKPAAPKAAFPANGGPGGEKKETAGLASAAANPLAASSGKPPADTWDFSTFADVNDAVFADDSARVSTSNAFEIVTEVAGPDDAPEIAAEVEGFDDADVFSSTSADVEANPAYKAFEEFLERQSAGRLSVAEQGSPKPVVAPGPVAATGAVAPAAAEMEMSDTVVKRETLASTRSERTQAQPAVDPAAGSEVRHPVPEIVHDGQRSATPCALQKSGLEIVSLLEERGMTDEYVVTKVQEVCEATRYVEGVERPDWPTRILGLDLLCKIKGLYPQEKKDEPANRQLQIVTGINM